MSKQAEYEVYKAFLKQENLPSILPNELQKTPYWGDYLIYKDFHLLTTTISTVNDNECQEKQDHISSKGNSNQYENSVEEHSDKVDVNQCEKSIDHSSEVNLNHSDATVEEQQLLNPNQNLPKWIKKTSQGYFIIQSELLFVNPQLENEPEIRKHKNGDNSASVSSDNEDDGDTSDDDENEIFVPSNLIELAISASLKFCYKKIYSCKHLYHFTHHIGAICSSLATFLKNGFPPDVRINSFNRTTLILTFLSHFPQLDAKYEWFAQQKKPHSSKKVVINTDSHPILRTYMEYRINYELNKPTDEPKKKSRREVQKQKPRVSRRVAESNRIKPRRKKALRSSANDTSCESPMNGGEASQNELSSNSDECALAESGGETSQEVSPSSSTDCALSESGGETSQEVSPSSITDCALAESGGEVGQDEPCLINIGYRARGKSIGSSEETVCNNEDNDINSNQFSHNLTQQTNDHHMSRTPKTTDKPNTQPKSRKKSTGVPSKSQPKTPKMSTPSQVFQHTGIKRKLKMEVEEKEEEQSEIIIRRSKRRNRGFNPNYS